MSEKEKLSLVFMPYSFMSPHTDVTLTYIQDQINSGTKVIILGCGGAKDISCGFNLYGSSLKCRYCVKRNLDALDTLRGDYEWVDINDFNSPQLPPEITLNILKAQSLEEIKKIQYQGSDIGYAIVSSLVSRFRTVEINDKKRNILIKLANGYVKSFYAAEKTIQDNNIKEAFVFNGRLELTRGFFRACEKEHIDCNILEVSQVGCKTLKYKNALPLDLGYTKSLIQSLWDTASTEQQKKAKEFYEKKAVGIAIHDQIYTTGQQKDLLPINWDENNKNLVIFGSSADEFFAIGPDWEFPFYKNQFDGLKRITEVLSESDIQIYFRMHPNLTMLKDAEISNEFKLSNSYPNFHVIAPQDKVSTYALMKGAEKVITFGSSVGVEAAYWNKDSILAGNSMYAHLEGIIRPNSHQELVNEIHKPSSKVVSKLGALMYSNFLLARGHDMEGLEITNSTVTFEGKRQESDFPVERMFFKILNIKENFKDWNTFSMAIRDILPIRVKRFLCKFIQH